MSYRSDVSITLTKVDYEEMIKLAKQTNDEVIIYFVTQDCTIYLDETNKMVNLVWYDVKWYNIKYTDFDYREINFVEDFINNKNYVKTILGENNTDISQDYHFINNETDEIKELFYECAPIIHREFDFGNSLEQ